MITPTKMSLAMFLILGCFVALNSAAYNAVEASVCPSLKFGRVPYPGDCQRFVRCFGFSVLATPGKCAATYAFNPKTSTCEPAKNVEGCEHTNDLHPPE